jgi:hypothetical protein
MKKNKQLYREGVLSELKLEQRKYKPLNKTTSNDFARLADKITNGDFDAEQQSPSLHFQKFSKETKVEFDRPIIILLKGNDSKISRVTTLDSINEHAFCFNVWGCDNKYNKKNRLDIHFMSTDAKCYRWAYIDHLWDAFNEKDTVPVDMSKDGSADKQYSVNIEEHPSFPKFDEKVHVFDTGEIEKMVDHAVAEKFADIDEHVDRYCHEYQITTDAICSHGDRLTSLEYLVLAMNGLIEDDSNRSNVLRSILKRYKDFEHTISFNKSKVGDEKEMITVQRTHIDGGESSVTIPKPKPDRPDLNKVFYEAEDVDGFWKCVGTISKGKFPGVYYECSDCHRIFGIETVAIHAEVHNCKDKK